MSEKPILMSTEMVRAILNGTKTVTRRAIKVQPRWYVSPPTSITRVVGGFTDDYEVAHPCPYGRVGDRLWVRETWRLIDMSYSYEYGWEDNGVAHGAIPKQKPDDFFHDRLCWEYLADCGTDDDPWRPSIHMPRWASRITLEIIGIDAHPLRCMTEEDACAEGFYPTGENTNRFSALELFRLYWDRHAKAGTRWDDNPWVWSVGIKKLPWPTDRVGVVK